MEAMIQQQVVDDVRTALRALIDSGVESPELPFLTVTPEGRTITIRGIVNHQYTVDVLPLVGERVTLTISEHLP